MLRVTLLCLGLLLLCPLVVAQGSVAPPNIIYILADDLGYGELGCYGQEKIRTPHLDRLAAGGMRFTQHYAGAPVCAPSRCVLMTGRASPRAEIRGNQEVKPEGQWPITDASVTVAELLRERGYATGAFGKWGLGPPLSTGGPTRQGFDEFYGYNCQRQAHTYYPRWLWHGDRKVWLNNPRVPGHQRLEEAPESYERFYGNEYAPDLIRRRALAFIRQHQESPFFLYVPFVEPHLAMQPPREWVERYPREWDDAPYIGNRGYVPHPRPRAGYAAMISDLDEHVGSIVSLVEELGLAERTLIIFSSDNGATHDVGGVDTTFFASTGPYRGRKGSVFEGGLRVPMIASWKGRIRASSTTDHPSAFQDVLPTLVEVAGGSAPEGGDGISFLPTLLGQKGQRAHAYLHWEFHGYGGQQAILMGQWKGVRRGMHKGNEKLMLYDLSRDPGESRDVAKEHPEIVGGMDEVLRRERIPSAKFRIEMLDGGG